MPCKYRQVDLLKETVSKISNLHLSFYKKVLSLLSVRKGTVLEPILQVSLKIGIVSMKVSLVSLFVFFCGVINAQSVPNALPIWPDSVGPGSEALQMAQAITSRPPTGHCKQDRIVEKVTMPVLLPFFAPKPNGVSVILCPGGGYQRLAIDGEGTDVAKWLNEQGISAFVLIYRLPADGHLQKEDVPLQDAQRAMRYVKFHAPTWKLDSSKVGVLGASAGGHVAASLSTGFTKTIYTPFDAMDQISARPSFQILLYPVISMVASLAHMGSRNFLLGTSPSDETIQAYSPDKQVKPNTPPTFIAVAKDDPSVLPANSQVFYDALQAQKIPSELRMYENGGHGKGICKAEGTDFAKWVKHCGVWLQEQKLANKRELGDTEQVVNPKKTKRKKPGIIPTIDPTAFPR